MATGYAAYTTGVIARFVDNSNFIALMVGAPARPPTTYTTATLLKVVAGTVTALGTSAYLATAAEYEVELTVRADGSYSAIVNGTQIASGAESDFATGGTLESGKSGIIDWYPSSTAATRTVQDFTVLIPESNEAAAYVGRSLRWENDGNLHREASAGTDYSYAQGQQGVGPPLLGPAGSEGIDNRLVIATDDQNPDYAATGNQLPQLDYTVYHRPAYALGRYGS